MFCKNCGKELKEGAIYCSGCGMPVHEAAEGTVSRNSVCGTDKTVHEQKGFFATIASIMISMFAWIAGIVGVGAIGNMCYIVYCLISGEPLQYPWISGLTFTAGMYFTWILVLLVASAVLFAIATYLTRLAKRI